MLYRIISTLTDNPANKTTVAVELIAQQGQITRIVEKVQFDIQGRFDGSSEGIYREVGIILKDNGYDVIVPIIAP